MKLRVENPRLTNDILTGRIDLTVTVASDCKYMVKDGVKELSGLLDLELKKHRKARSLSANDCLWVLCTKMAEALSSTKEEVYRELVKRVGRSDILAVMAGDLDTFINGWSNRGIGWFAEEMPGCKLDGCARVIVYYGSSDYDTKEMSRLVDEAVNEAKGLGIETMPPHELEALKGRWNEKKN